MGYLVLGGVFTANMTGNTVLLGIAIGRGRLDDAALSATALAGFCAGAWLGAVVAQAATAFALEAGALAAGAAVGGRSVHAVSIALVALAMGVQTGAVKPRNETGVNVSYLTGTITIFLARLARRSDEDSGAAFPASVWLTYLTGAVLGALLTRVVGSAALIAPALIAGTSAVAAHRVTRAPAG